MEKVLGRLSQDDITLPSLPERVAAIWGWQADAVAVQTPINEQCGQVPLLATRKSLMFSKKDRLLNPFS